MPFPKVTLPDDKYIRKQFTAFLNEYKRIADMESPEYKDDLPFYFDKGANNMAAEEQDAQGVREGA